MIFRRQKNSREATVDSKALENAYERFKQTHDLKASADAFGVEPRLLEARIRPFDNEQKNAMAEKLDRRAEDDTFSKSGK